MESQTQEDPSNPHPLFLHAVLTKVFAKLSVTDLKSARLVCQTWKRSSFLQWRREAVLNVIGDGYLRRRSGAHVSAIPEKVEMVREMPFLGLKMHCDTFDDTSLEQIVSLQLDKAVFLELRRYRFDDCFRLQELLRHAPSLRTLRFSLLEADRKSLSAKLSLVNLHTSLHRLEICSSDTDPWLMEFLLNFLPKLPSLTELKIYKDKFNGANCVVKSVTSLCCAGDKQEMPKLKSIELLGLTPCSPVDLEKFMDVVTKLEKSVEHLEVSVLFSHAITPMMATEATLEELDVQLVPYGESARTRESQHKGRTRYLRMDERIQGPLLLSYKYLNSAVTPRTRSVRLQVLPEGLATLEEGAANRQRRRKSSCIRRFLTGCIS